MPAEDPLPTGDISFFPKQVIDPRAYFRLSRGQAGFRPLEYDVTERGCYVPRNHRLQEGRYTRIRRSRFDGIPGRDYLHRIAYRYANCLDEIPDGMEIDHRCGNKGCFNPAHLWMLSIEQHTYLTNKTRNDHLKEELAILWLMHSRNISIADLADALEVSPARVRNWLEEFEAEQANDRERWGIAA